MSNESSQILKSEDSTKIEMPESIKLAKPTKLHIEKIERLLLSPNSKYAATWSAHDRSICGWLLDQPVAKQSIEQSENEFHQSKPFKFDRLINVEDLGKYYDVSLIAVSNNKLIAIKSRKDSQEIIEVINFNLETPKKIELNLNPFAHRYSMDE
ncbi:4153_t:CDS:2, partial [Gigaspora rosea]